MFCSSSSFLLASHQKPSAKKTFVTVARSRPASSNVDNCPMLCAKDWTDCRLLPCGPDQAGQSPVVDTLRTSYCLSLSIGSLIYQQSFGRYVHACAIQNSYPLSGVRVASCRQACWRHIVRRVACTVRLGSSALSERVHRHQTPRVARRGLDLPIIFCIAKDLVSRLQL